MWKNADIVNMKIDTNTLSSNILKHKHDLQKKYREHLESTIRQPETLSRNERGRFGALNLIQPTISLEMPVPSQGHYGFHSFPVVD